MTLKNGTLPPKDPDSCPVRIIKPYPITHRFKVKQEESGKTLAELMLQKFPFRSEEEWLRRIEKGLVGVEGEHRSNPLQQVKAGIQLFHHNPAVIEPAVPDEVSIISEAEDHLIVFKPAPMPVHPGGRYNKNTLISILAEMGYEDLKVVHRLDAVTMGLILFGRDKKFARKAMESFATGQVTKKYYAIVEGVPEKDQVTIDTPVRRKKGFVFETVSGLDKAKEAMTRFEVTERGNNKSIICCMPVTGRTHQIRLHLRQWGYPIVDDLIYKDDTDASGPQNNAISLLNAGLNIPGLGISEELPVPSKWSEFIRR